MARGLQSSAKFIPYDLRPAKQTERRIILDTLQLAGDAGLATSKYRYVGMGGNRFYDFVLIHKYLGTSEMVSLEHDNIMFDRACFNQPYKFIKIKKTNTQEFIDTDRYKNNSVYWFDYDGGLSSEMTADISSMGTKLIAGDFFFITVHAGVPRYLGSSTSERFSWAKEKFGDLAGDLKQEDMGNHKFYNAVSKILTSSLKNAFAYSENTEFFIYLKIKYNDTQPMITIGGVLVDKKQKRDLKKTFSKTMPFLSITRNNIFILKVPNVTEKRTSSF